MIGAAFEGGVWQELPYFGRDLLVRCTLPPAMFDHTHKLTLARVPVRVGPCLGGDIKITRRSTEALQGSLGPTQDWELVRPNWED